MKDFVAEFRSPSLDGIGPKIVWKVIRASSEKEAKIVGKGLSGRADDLKWFMRIDPYLTKAYRNGEVQL